MVAQILPLLGILGGAAAFAGRGPINNALQNQRGQRYAASGLDFGGTPEGDQLQMALEAGMLGPQLFGGQREAIMGGIDQMFQGRQGDLDRANNIRRAQIAAAPGMLNAQLNRQKYADQVNAQKAEREAALALGVDEVFYDIPQLRNQAYANIGTNSRELGDLGKTPEQIAADNYSRFLAQQALDEENRRFLSAADDAFAAEEQAAQFAFIEETWEPVMSSIEGIDTALAALPTANFGREFSQSRDATLARNAVNQTLYRLSQGFWSGELGRSDAPSEAEQEQLQALFPQINRNLFNRGNMRELIEYILKQAKVREESSIETARRALTRRGYRVPSGYE